MQTPPHSKKKTSLFTASPLLVSSCSEAGDHIDQKDKDKYEEKDKQENISCSMLARGHCSIICSAIAGRSSYSIACHHQIIELRNDRNAWLSGHCITWLSYDLNSRLLNNSHGGLNDLNSRLSTKSDLWASIHLHSSIGETGLEALVGFVLGLLGSEALLLGLRLEVLVHIGGRRSIIGVRGKV